ncbi:hypothetical protein DH2020_014012 [Rehmannia glutinosa]|uniref:Aladin n=1 Tax=Rehmannia glutinosa TaxID=99300 RepID=A0ABR0WYB0_REHGL
MPSFPPPGTVTVCEINRELGNGFTKEGHFINSAARQALLSGSLRPLFQPADVKLLQDIDLHSLSWHHHKQILAFISGPHHVTICDYNDSDGKALCVLSNESQKDVKILEWRPNGGKTLSVACKGGICIWAASYPGNVPSVRSGLTSNTLSRGSTSRCVLVDFLQSFDSEQISALSWSPDGRYPNQLLVYHHLLFL